MSHNGADSIARYSPGKRGLTTESSCEYRNGPLTPSRREHRPAPPVVAVLGHKPRFQTFIDPADAFMPARPLARTAVLMF